MSGATSFTTHDPACDRCRAKKIRCDRERPSCESCRREQTPCKFSAKEPRSLDLRAEEQDEISRRLVSVESSVSNLMRLITDSENRCQLRMLQLENRLLSRAIAAREGTEARHPNERAQTELFRSRFNGGARQTHRYATPSASSHQAIPRGLEYSNKRQCVCNQHGSGSGGFEDLFPTGNNSEDFTAGLNLDIGDEWDTLLLDPANLPTPATSDAFGFEQSLG